MERELTIDELQELFAAVDRETNYPSEWQRQKQADATNQFCDEMVTFDREQAADELDALVWKDPFTSYPMWAPTRFMDRFKQEYVDWITSDDPHAERTRRNLHPGLEERIAREQRDETATSYRRRYGPNPTETR
jgi:hypothetical protein